MLKKPPLKLKKDLQQYFVFGQRNPKKGTYIDHKDKELRKNYRARHKKDLDTKDYKRAGHLSYYILWGDKTNLTDAVKDYKKRFNLS